MTVETTSEFDHYFHTDQETPDTVPWTGLEATTRAYARIIDELNKLALTDLQRPEEPAPSSTPSHRGSATVAEPTFSTPRACRSGRRDVLVSLCTHCGFAPPSRWCVPTAAHPTL